MSRFIGRVGVGMLVSFPITCIVAGGVQNGLGLLLTSIVCTAGIGLVAWIPLWWMVGGVTLRALALFSNVNVEAKPDSPSTSVPDRRELQASANRALTAFIKQATDTGMEVDEMTRRLQLNGWEAAEIQRAYQSVISSRSKTQGA